MAVFYIRVPQRQPDDEPSPRKRSLGAQPNPSETEICDRPSPFIQHIQQVQANYRLERRLF
ncbi:MAG: hypothetical protein MUF49_00160 [Oculatellaceae cyanobacterium Prado106]|nr:hypothetical protein [Oculatellaceae cyanobacterium Prado106]